MTKAGQRKEILQKTKKKVDLMVEEAFNYPMKHL